jgi:hypothetical protein
MKQVAHDVPIAGTHPLKIFAVTQSINYFVTPDLTPATVAGAFDGVASMPGRTRRRYPSDARPYSVSGGSRQWEYDPGSRSESALPGKTFKIAYKDQDGVRQVRQFTFQGRWIDLKNWLKANKALAMTIYSPSGRATDLKAPANP